MVDNPYNQIIKCYRCHEVGHKSNVCLKRRGVHVCDGEGLKEAHVEESKDDIDQVYPDDGAHLSCMIH